MKKVGWLLIAGLSFSFYTAQPVRADQMRSTASFTLVASPPTWPTPGAPTEQPLKRPSPGPLPATGETQHALVVWLGVGLLAALGLNQRRVNRRRGLRQIG